jgi:hypothetical protein
LPGRVGDSLYDVAKRYKYEFIDGACGGGGSPRDVFHKEGSWYLRHPIGSENLK